MVGSNLKHGLFASRNLKHFPTGRCSFSARNSPDAYSDTSERKSGGAGVGNVEDKMLPSTFNENKLFRYCQSPRTTSIIG